MSINVKAKSVTDLKNGVFSIEIEGRSLSTEESKTIEKLFPRLSDAAWKLLNQEALLESLATDSEIQAEPKKQEQEVPKKGKYAADY